MLARCGGGTEFIKESKEFTSDLQVQHMSF
jgi:hypothetical protein